jgi:hypothetical protein
MEGAHNFRNVKRRWAWASHLRRVTRGTGCEIADMQLLPWAQNINLATPRATRSEMLGAGCPSPAPGKLFAAAPLMHDGDQIRARSCHASDAASLASLHSHCTTRVLPCEARPARPISPRGLMNWPCLHSTRKSSSPANHMSARVPVCLSPDVSAPLYGVSGDSIPPRRQAFQPRAAQTRVRFLVMAPGLDY